MIARNIDLAYVIYKLQGNTLFESRDTMRGGGSKTNRRENASATMQKWSMSGRFRASSAKLREFQGCGLGRFSIGDRSI
jgi:hypothetical protein